MPSQPIIPPPEKMVRQIQQSDHTVALYTELVSRESTRFQALSPIKRGTPYASTIGADQRVVDLHGNALIFLKEIVPFGGTSVNTTPGNEFVLWYWSTDHLADHATDAEVSYPYDTLSCPAYTHITTVKRDDYDASPTVAYGSALTTLQAVKITAPGIGYVNGDVVTISGSHGCAVEIVVDANGAITNAIVVNEGLGLDSAALPTIGITTATGSGATLVAIVQPKTALLSSQKKSELPDSDPYSHEFVQLTRVWETLPGALLPFTRWDELLGPIQGTRQAVVNSGQAASLTATAKITYEARQDSSYVAWKLTEDWSANGGYPITYAKYHDDQRGEVSRTTQLEVKASQVSSSVVSGGIVTQTNYTEFDQFHYKKVVETWAVPRTLNGQDIDEELDVLMPYQLKREAAGTSIGTAHAFVTPKGDGTDETKLIDIAAWETAMAAYLLTFPGTASIDLPDVLEDIVTAMERSTEDGDATETGFGYQIQNAGSVVDSPDSVTDASVILTPVVAPIVSSIVARHVPTTHYLFFLKAPVTTADVLAALPGVSEFPIFHLKSGLVVSVARSADLRVTASAYHQYGFNANSDPNTLEEVIHTGTGKSVKLGMVVRFTQIPQTIGSVSVSDSDSEEVSATATATEGIGLFSATRTETATVDASVEVFGANSGDELPSGDFLLDSNCRPYKFGWVQVQAEVVNLSL